MQTSRRSLLRALAALPAVAALATAFRPDRASAASPALARGLFDPATPTARVWDVTGPVDWHSQQLDLLAPTSLPRFVGADYGLSEPTFSVVEVESTAAGTMRYRLLWTYGSAGRRYGKTAEAERWRIEQPDGQIAEVVAWETDVSPDGMRTTYAAVAI